MSKRQILSALKNKGLGAKCCQYDRGCPTPDGYWSGWHVVLDGESEEAILSAGYEDDAECEELSSEDVLEWIEGLPNINAAMKESK